MFVVPDVIEIAYCSIRKSMVIGSGRVLDIIVDQKSNSTLFSIVSYNFVFRLAYVVYDTIRVDWRLVELGDNYQTFTFLMKKLARSKINYMYMRCFLDFNKVTTS